MTPYRLTSLDKVVGVAAKRFGAASAALRSDGTVWAWGQQESFAPMQKNGLNNVVEIAGGGSHFMALRSDGTIWAWGSNAYGQLGDGTTVSSGTPVQVLGLNQVVAITAGWDHSLALLADGSVWGWGDNVFGQLSTDVSRSTQLSPIQISGLSGIVSISAGNYHSVALHVDGSVWVWGNDSHGVLGTGQSRGQAFPPVRLASPTGVVQVISGGSHILARRSDGTLWAWGSNGAGQVGSGVSSSISVPIQVLTSVESIGAGNSCSYAVRMDGTLWAWGYNDYGQLGDGSTTDRLTPVQIVGQTAVAHTSGGWGHSLFQRADGSLWASGSNSNGELGDGTSAHRYTPSEVLLPTPLLVSID